MTPEELQRRRTYGHTGSLDWTAAVESHLANFSQRASSAYSEEEALAAFGELQLALGLLSVASTEDPDAASKILEKLSKRIHKLKKDLEAIVAKSDAKGFSISVGVPLGISVSVEW